MLSSYLNLLLSWFKNIYIVQKINIIINSLFTGYVNKNLSTYHEDIAIIKKKSNKK